MRIDNFIKRPILSAVISILIVLVGVLSVFTLPIEQYPDIAPPTVSVSTSFFGANCETLVKSVITPLEESINGVENMMYMESKASNNGDVDITVTFRQGTDPDMATVNVQNRVQKTMPLLPAEVNQYGVTVEKRLNSMLQVFSVCSPDDTYDYEFLGNYADINIQPRALLIHGIGKFQMLGSKYSMRIWLDPGKLQLHQLTPTEVGSILANQNIEAATGSFGENSNESFQYAMRYTGRLKTIDEFNKIVIRSNADGTVLHLEDIAHVELGIESYNLTGETDGHPSVMCIAYQNAGSNATKVNNEITALLDEIRAEAPAGIEVISLMNTNDFLYSAIDQVIETLRDALILVVLIVLIFLKDFKSTLIPFMSIMVSLIGTFAFMTIAGFSINLLTLFALVLVIGTVVDDSIVVVEAVHAKFESGITSPFKATVAASQEVSMAVLTSSLVFMAVFIPVSFLGGTSGVFYKQFGLTMAVAVGISALNALTLVPALSALMLHHIEKVEKGQAKTWKQRYAVAFDGFFERFSNGYQNFLSKFMNKKAIIWGIVAGSLALLGFLLYSMPSGLVPNEDQGIIFVEVSNPPGTSLYTSNEVVSKIAADIKQIPGIEHVAATAGYGFIAGANSSAACMVIRLDPWDERGGETSLKNIYKNINLLGLKYPEANLVAFSIPMIPGYGNNNGITMYVQNKKGAPTAELNEVTNNFLDDLKQFGIHGFVTFNMDFPQWEVSVDAAKCMRAGLSTKDVLSTVGAFYGGSYVSDINLYSKVYKVMIQGDPSTRRDETSLDQACVRTASGEMSPLSNFVTIKRIFGPETMSTFNKFTAISVSVSSGMTDGETIAILKDSAKKYLPEGYDIDFSGMSREQSEQGSLGPILILCIFIIYLILAALYESMVIPFAVLLSVPLALAASYGATYLSGLDNNIYVQTGVIMLIGLVSKTALLITEYAVEKHRHGMPIMEAALAAAGDRLRPIIMTAATMVIGLLPLITSINGVGGMGNFSLGLGTVCGMLIGTIGLLFITPVLYTTFQSLQDKILPPDKAKFDDDNEEE